MKKKITLNCPILSLNPHFLNEQHATFNGIASLIFVVLDLDTIIIRSIVVGAVDAPGENWRRISQHAAFNSQLFLLNHIDTVGFDLHVNGSWKLPTENRVFHSCARGLTSYLNLSCGLQLSINQGAA